MIGFPFGRCEIVSLVVGAADNCAEDVRRRALARDGALLKKLHSWPRSPDPNAEAIPRIPELVIPMRIGEITKWGHEVWGAAYVWISIGAQGRSGNARRRCVVCRHE